jgi:hypothetical protein
MEPKAKEQFFWPQEPSIVRRWSVCPDQSSLNWSFTGCHIGL